MHNFNKDKGAGTPTAIHLSLLLFLPRVLNQALLVVDVLGKLQDLLLERHYLAARSMNAVFDIIPQILELHEVLLNEYYELVPFLCGGSCCWPTIAQMPELIFDEVDFVKATKEIASGCKLLTAAQNKGRFEEYVLGNELGQERGIRHWCP